MGTIKISTLTRPLSNTGQPKSIQKRSRKAAGFTLIEILVVVALMGLVFAVALPGIGGAIRATIENSSRDIATTTRAAYDEAILKGRVHRMAFDLEKNQYWVEMGPQNFTLMTVEQIEEERRLNERRTDEEKAARPRVVWGIAKEVTRDKISLPSGVEFTDVITTQSTEPITGGIVYAHIFPHGFIEKLNIHIKDNSQHEASILVDPISGKSQVFNSYVKDTEK